MDMNTLRLKCSLCGGIKFIGDPYYANGTYYVDVTCVICSHSKDIELEKLNDFLSKLKQDKVVVNDNKKTSS
jgi:hypothetical protein